MPRFSDADAVLLPARDRTRRVMLSLTWAAVAAFVVGAPAAYLLSTELSVVSYTADGVLWIKGASQVDYNGAPAMRSVSSGPLDNCSWTLCSPYVLGPVILEQRLYLRAPEEYAEAFASFSVADRFDPGTYQVGIDQAGDQFVLLDGTGVPLQKGTLGSPIGRHVGFLWAPPSGALPAGTTVEFSVLSFEDSEQDLASRLVIRENARSRRAVGVSITWPDPQQAAEVLNAVMDRYVDLSADGRPFQLISLPLDAGAGARIEAPSLGGVACSFGGTVADRLPDQPTLGADSPRDELGTRVEDDAPAVRILDYASGPHRPNRGNGLPIAALTFLGCFCLALGGFLRSSRTALMDTDDV